MQLIYFSPVPWNSHRQRPQEFVHWFHERFAAPVLWVEPYPGRLPRWADLRRPTPQSAGEGEAPAWLERVTPRALPFEPFAWGRTLNRTLLWQGLVQHLQAAATRDATMLAIGKPSHLALHTLESLKPAFSLYDAMDDFPAFYRGRSRDGMAALERQLVMGVRCHCASSTALETRLQGFGTKVLHVPNGLSATRCQAAWPYRAGHPRSLGYVGTIGSWFDWDWVCRLARAWPDRPVEIIGPLFQPPPATLPQNVALLPALRHDLALRRMASFAAGLIPFRVNALTASVDPLKYYEYRGLGLPVLSTPFGEMIRHGGADPGVLLTPDPAADRAGIDALLARPEPGADREAFCAQHDWRRRFDILLSCLEVPGVRAPEV